MDGDRGEEGDRAVLRVVMRVVMRVVIRVVMRVAITSGGRHGQGCAGVRR